MTRRSSCPTNPRTPPLLISSLSPSLTLSPVILYFNNVYHVYRRFVWLNFLSYILMYMGIASPKFQSSNPSFFLSFTSFSIERASTQRSSERHVVPNRLTSSWTGILRANICKAFGFCSSGESNPTSCLPSK